MRKKRQFKAGRCYHLVSRIAERLYADRADYRHNTPLQLNVEGVKLAGKTFSVRCSRKEGTKVFGSVQLCQQGLSQ